MFDISTTYSSGILYSQRRLNDRYFIDYIEGNQTLVITFNAYGMINERTIRTEEPWGFKFLHRHGLSVLGIKPLRAEWYRGDELHAFLRSAEFFSFINRFKRIILYGTSMGGFAALVFSDAIPNSEVFALNPQTTLDPRIVPWEKRWKIGQNQNWNGDFSDAAKYSRRAKKIYVTYDPFYTPDRIHVDRLTSSNITRIQIPLVGHSTTIWLNKMGLLKDLFRDILEDTYDAKAFRQASRKRRTLARYYIQLAHQAGRKHSRLRNWSLQRASELGEADPTAFLELASMHVTDRNFGAAESLLRKFTEIRPNYPHGYYQLSQLMHRIKQKDKAVAFAEKAISISPKNITYQTWLDQIAERAG